MDDNEQLTAEEQAALDAQRNTPEPEAPEPAPDAPEAPQEGAGGAEDEAEAPEQPEAGKRPQMVPHAALHEERKKRQEIERQAAEDRRRFEARVERLLELVPQPAAQPEAPAPAIPDVQADPVGHIVGTLQQLGASQQQIQQAVEEQRRRAEQQQLVATVQQRAGALEIDYRAKNPGYDDALSHLRQLRDRQLQSQGMMDPAQRAQQIAFETFQIAAMALQQDANPAERLHRMAEASGWTAPATAMPSEINDAARQNAGAAPDQAARLQMVQRGQAHASTLGRVPGNGPSPLTAAKIAEMPDDDFEAIIKVMKSKEARKLMGA